MRYLAALRDGRGLVYMSGDGRWLPKSAFNVSLGPLRIRAFRNPASAIEVADLFARRLGCGWRVEMVP
jgi:hypothetical protein